MDYKELNSKLRNLAAFRNTAIPVFQTEREYEGASFEEVYDIGLEDGMFLKLYISSDSYGDNESINGVEFVKGKEKTVIVYEF